MFYADIFKPYISSHFAHICPIALSSSSSSSFFLLFSPPLILPTQICIIFFLFSCHRSIFIFESRFLYEKKTLYLSCGWVVDIAKAKSLQRPYAKCKKAIFLQGPEQEVANAGQRQI